MLYIWNDVGVGVAPDAAGFPMCVFNVGQKSTYGQVSPAGTGIAYSYPGQTGVERAFFIGYEVQRPLPSEITALTAGSPVLVSIKNADFDNAKAAGTLNAVCTRTSKCSRPTARPSRSCRPACGLLEEVIYADLKAPQRGLW